MPQLTYIYAPTVGGAAAGITTTVDVATGGAEVDVGPISIAGGSTDLEVSCGFVAAQVKFFYVVATRPMTLKANNAGAPDYTLNLGANVPLVWFSGCGYANPLTHATTRFFVTLAAGPDATLTLRVDYDPTP